MVTVLAGHRLHGHHDRGDLLGVEKEKQMIDWMEWTPISKLPNEPMRMFLCVEYPDGSRNIEITEGVTTPYLPYRDRHMNAHIIGWMPLEPILNAPRGYNPLFGDIKLCLCGHPYYRHFDTYDEMRPVGCKYCGYSTEADEGIEYRVEVKPIPPQDPSTMTEEAWNAWLASVKDAPRIHSLCSGFKWDGVDVPLADWEVERHAQV